MTGRRRILWLPPNTSYALRVRTRDDQWGILALARFILAMTVMLAHLERQAHLPAWWTHVGPYLNPNSAVFGFLLISGYSIAASLDREATGFYWRRVRRIYPTYLASVVLTIAGIAVGALRPERPALFAASVLMLQTFVAPALAQDNQLWTIAVEWWNYMLAPLYRRFRDPYLILVALLSLGLYLIIFTGPPGDSTGGKMFATLSWFWIVGFLYHHHRRTWFGRAILMVPLALVARIGWVGPAVWIGVAALLACEHIPLPQGLKAPSRWLGDWSYPIYAMHMPVFWACVALGMKSSALIAAIALAISLVVLHAVDLPGRQLKLRQRLRPALATE